MNPAPRDECLEMIRVKNDVNGNPRHVVHWLGLEPATPEGWTFRPDMTAWFAPRAPSEAESFTTANMAAESCFRPTLARCPSA